jgi:hypothetical protein
MRDNSRFVFAVAAVAAVCVAFAYVSRRAPSPRVITQDVGSAQSGSSRGRIAPPLQTPPGGQATCSGTPPSPDWVCQNGAWQSATSGTSGTNAAPVGGNGAGGCLGAQPGAGWACVGGAWIEQSAATSTPSPNMPPSTIPIPTAGSLVQSTSASTSSGVGSDGPQCPGNPPSPDWVCRSGAWTAAPTNATNSVTPAAPPPGGTPTACTSPAPGPNYSCQNGSWVIR